MQSSSGDSAPLPPPNKPTFVAKYRVASPVLRPTPLTTSRGPFASKLQSCVVPIRDTAEQILDSHKIMDDDTEVNVVYREKRGAPNTGVATLFIINRWNDNSPKTWPPAVKEIMDFADQYLKDAECDETFHVEMIAPERVMPKYLAPAPSLPGLAQAWPELQSAIHQKLDTYQATRSYVIAIGLFSLGFHPNPLLNPTTVYISLEDDSDETQWGAISRHLESYIHDQGWTSLAVHMEHNVVERYVFQLNLPEGTVHRTIRKAKTSNHFLKGDYQHRVNLGASIGAAQYLRLDGSNVNPSTGTLGCYVEIRVKGSTEWQKFGLTNYHVMRPCMEGFVIRKTEVQPPPTPRPGDTTEQIKADSFSVAEGVPRGDSDLWTVDHKGFRQAKYDPMKLESPARVKHNYTIWDLNQRIQEKKAGEPGWRDAEYRHAAMKVQEMERDKAAKISFFDTNNNDFGSVRLASGLARRTPQRNHRLDWAVIEIPASRIGENRLPTEEVWEAKYQGRFTPYAGTFGALLQQPSSDSLKTMALNTSVWKVGATSGATHGVYNEYKVTCKLKDDAHIRGVPRYSEQFVVIGNDLAGEDQDGRFCGSGDSGAVVFNAKGEALGLLFSGQRPDQSPVGYGLVTPIEDVFEDIKAYSKGVVEEIRIAVN